MEAKKIRELSEKYRDYTALNLAKMVRVQGFSRREKGRCELIVELCKEAGFDDVYIDGLGSVVGRVGNGPKVLAFDAHIDTVGIGDIKQWNKDPFCGEISDELVYGLGSNDQLGGAASMITAGRILKELGYDGEYTIYFTFTVMEEDCDGLCWLYLIQEEGLKPDYVVSSEPTNCKLFTGQRGRMEIEIQLRGLSAHGSLPETGDSAAYKAAKAALAIEQLEHDLQPDEDGFLGKGSVTVSQMEVFGPSQCAVPDIARLYLDRRLTWGEDADLAIRQVKDYVSEAVGEAPYKVYMPDYEGRGYKDTDFTQELYFPAWKTDPNSELPKACQQAHRDLFGEEIIVGPCVYSTNAVAFAGRHHIPSVVMGPGDVDGSHIPNETNRVSDIVKCSALYAMLPQVL